MTKEELGLLWHLIVECKIIKHDKPHDCTDDEMDFILKACNHHHALVEALEKIAELEQPTSDNDAVQTIVHGIAMEALEVVK